MAEMTRPKRREIILVLIILSVLLPLIYLGLFKNDWSTYKGDGFSINHPSSWFIQTFPVNDAELAKKEEYLFIIDNTKQSISGEGYKTEGPEYVRIIASRLLKEGTEYQVSDLANQETSRLTSSLNRESKRLKTKVAGMPTVEVIITSSSNEDPFKKHYIYWIDTDKYIYKIMGILFIDKPLIQAWRYDFLIGKTIRSFKLEE